jgi:HK97 family phage portal protein
MSQAQYIQTLVGYWLLSGNRYQERVMVGSEPRELYPIRPDRMKVTPGSDGLPAGYQFDVNGRKHIWEMTRPDFDCDILHERTFNPLDDWYGMSPLQAGTTAVVQHNNGMMLSVALLQNSARPSGALVVQKDGSGAYGSLPDEEYNRLKSQLEDQFQGSGNAGRPMILEGGLDWRQMGLSPNDMDMLDTRYAAARDVSLALGVPPLLLNIPGDSTYSNYKEARGAFWEDTVIPLCKQIAEGWTQWLGPKFGNIEVRPDFDDIPAVAEKRREMWDMADKATDLTLNERREIKGYEEIEGGDTIFVSANQIPLSDATMTPSAQEPPMTAEEAKAVAYGSVEFGSKIKAVK